jgi:acetyl-CoA carboxylase biotin carboxyl carrier protein
VPLTPALVPYFEEIGLNNDGSGLISDIHFRQIIALIEALDRSDFDSLQLDAGHFRLTLGKSTESAAQLGITELRSAAPAPVQASQVPAAARPAQHIEKQTREKRSEPASGTNTVDVCSPIMGMFYAKPDPASPPFVSLGTEVDEGTTVGLVEVMKVFNAIAAGAEGTIVEVCVEDAETIEIGQTLFRIRPKS